MADTPQNRPISGLEELIDIVGDEQIAVVSQGKTKRLALNKLKQVTVTKETLGLGKVDNTSDLEKPVSQAQQSALNEKADKLHTHEIGDVNGLELALDGKAALHHSHGIEDIVDFDQKVIDVVNNAENLDLANVVRTGQMQW